MIGSNADIEANLNRSRARERERARETVREIERETKRETYSFKRGTENSLFNIKIYYTTGPPFK